MRRVTQTILAAYLVITMSSCARAQDAKPKAATPENVIVEKDLVYGKAGERELKLDLVRPKTPGDKPIPVIVYIHGGGWRGGDKSGATPGLAQWAKDGKYVHVSVGYRFSQEAIWPAQLHDCKAAVRWLRANAEKYNIDPNRIGAWGHSAGGHLVGLLATTGDVPNLEGECGSPGQSSRVNCVIDCAGPSDLVTAWDQLEGWKMQGLVRQLIAGLIGGDMKEKRDVAAAASPITYVTKGDAPIMIIHGTKDELVPYEQATALESALKKAEIETELVTIEGGGHSVGGLESLTKITGFFEKHLRESESKSE